jgi:hypothetical protein
MHTEGKLNRPSHMQIEGRVRGYGGAHIGWNHVRGVASDWAERNERNFGPCHPASLTRLRALHV